MPSFTNASKLANHQQVRARKTVASLRAGHKKLAYEMAAEMRRMASGTISTAELRRRGHPFGRRGGRSTVKAPGGRVRGLPGRITTPLLPINKQTGRLLRSLRIIPESGIGLQSFRVQFTAPHSKFVLAKGGTRRMVARGYHSELRKRFIPKNKQFIYQARLNQLKAAYAA